MSMSVPTTMPAGPAPSATPGEPYPPRDNPTVPPERTLTEPPFTDAPPGGYRPPFAPHGPYASSGSPYAQSLGYSAPSGPYPGLAPAPPPRPPKPPRVRSPLGRITLSVICLALGALVVIDVSGASIPATAYLASTLGVVGLGLLVGAWLGRARWLILPGVVLMLALAGGTAAENVNFGDGLAGRTGEVTWVPTTVAELENNNYRVDVGNATLDLSKVDFADHTESVTISVDVGNLLVILPPNVDVDVSASLDGGSADVLGQHWDGMGNDSRRVHDNGADGVGGGTLQLDTSVALGKLEVRR
jgi:hypothetical protein